MKWLRRAAALALAVSLLAPQVASARIEDIKQQASSTISRVVVIGGTGDLAAKYLWVACFRLAFHAFIERHERVYFTAAARESQQEGDEWKHRFFNAVWARRVCSGDTRTANQCESFYRTQFVPSIAYAPLASEQDYESLSTRWSRDAITGTEIGRLVYLALPSSVFLQAARMISKYLRPLSLDSYLRVVVEKPFGRDLMSARDLARSLRQVLSVRNPTVRRSWGEWLADDCRIGTRQDEEMLLMDHYAGKGGVRVMRPFVQANIAALGRKWNGDWIKSISVAMTETETCEHRLEYFQEAGIIRDVLANHLHLLLGIIGTAASPTCTGERLCDGRALDFIESLGVASDFILGQYQGYHANTSHTTATAAHVEFTSSLRAWQGTRFSMSAAKATAQRKADVRVLFRRGHEPHAPTCSLQFVIQEGPRSNGARIQSDCPELTRPSPPVGWHQSHTASTSSIVRDSSIPLLPWHRGLAVSAYDTLLVDAASGNRDKFMTIDEVLAAWMLWSPIVSGADAVDREAIIYYPIGASLWMEPTTSSCAPRGFIQTASVFDTCTVV